MSKLHFFLGVALCTAIAAPVQSQASQVVISEFMASNTRGLLDNFGDRPDWIEIHNTGNGAVNLLDWCLTDSAGNLTKWRFPATNIAAGAYMIIYASGRDLRVAGAPLHANFTLTSSGEYLALVEPDGTTIATEFAPQYPSQVPDVSYGYGVVISNAVLIATNAAVRVRIPPNSNDDATWMTPGYDDSAWTAGTNGVGYGAAGAARAYIATDVGPAMSNLNASAYIRIPFVVIEPTNLTALTVRMRYNDGLVAWLNGTPVISANAPATPAFDSAATATHSSATLETIVLGSGLLQAGTNFLAVQGLNVAASDTDFLTLVEVSATATLTETFGAFFTTPTPGAANVGGVITPGPFIEDVTHVPNVPLDNEDLRVTARVLPSINPVGNVTMVYRIMFDAEVPVPMFDDGAHNDGLAGDGIFGASIPASASTNGQMIRYYIRAVDSQSRTSRWPQYLTAIDTAQYLGTIVQPVNVSSKLPVIHLFAPPTVLQPPSATATTQTGADSQAGAAGVSVFFDGEFYDNIYVSLRGNTTAGYNKKSHRFEFNREHQFRHPGPGGRLRKTSFVADYPDPTYMRQGLSFWLCNQLGSPAPFYYPVRLQLNGQFYQLANHNDVHTSELLSRLGYDPEGALYNAAGTVQTNKQSTGGFDKKTRRWETPDGDYFSMAYSIHETNSTGTRMTNIFNRFDVPNALNYLVAARWAHENDDVWANMSLYHDNDGDDLWRIIAFDMNLSWGAIYYEGGTPSVIEGVQSTNDIHKAFPLYGSAQATALSGPGAPNNYNRVYDSFFQVPQTREMFLRRMRTMMDTQIKPPGTPSNAVPAEVVARTWRDLIADEARTDRILWGWPAKSGQCNFDPPPNAGAFSSSDRTNSATTNLTLAVEGLLNEFIAKRRLHFYGKHCITNTALAIGIAKDQNAGIPLSQPSDSVISITAIEFNPSNSNQLHEYICVTNGNPYALDISGWKLDGGVHFKFHQGTVMPSNSVLYVSPDVRAFKARPTAPKGGMGLFVVGPYEGQLSARGESLTLADTVGRMVYSNAFVGLPSPAQQFLRITELMYNPSPLAGNTNDPQAFEYIELKNISAGTTLDLNGVKLVNGVEFAFTGSAVTSLAPGARVLVVRNTNAFTARYGGGLPVAGQYTGTLDNGGERLQLLDNFNEEILDFSYNNTWYPASDGYGFSLVVVDENAEPDLWDSKLNWRASGALSGSPGVVDPPPPPLAPILINEILTHSVPPEVDKIELLNPTASPVNIGGWFLSDDVGEVFKYRFTNGTTIPAGGYLVIDENEFNNPAKALVPFAFSAAGDEVRLSSGDANNNLTGYVASENFGPAEANVSFGRYTNSQGTVQFVAQAANSFGSPNGLPRVGSVVISEIMYHPPDQQALINPADNEADEYIELKNITASSQPLYDPNAPTNTWRLRDAVDFTFPTNVLIPPQGHVLVVSFDPSDAAAASDFRFRNGASLLTPLFGPWQGKLDNSSDSVELTRPNPPTTNGVSYFLADKVHYGQGAGWTTNADGTGLALRRVTLSQYGDDPINWFASGRSPGFDPSSTNGPLITAQPQNATVLGTLTAMFSVTASGAQPIAYQWRFNGSPLAGATNSLLLLPGVQLSQAGQYSCLLENPAGVTVSSTATLTVVTPANITQHPTNTEVRVRPDPATDVAPATNAAFFVTATTGNPPLGYQWRMNGTNLLPSAHYSNVTAAALIISNVVPADFGDYSCAVTDGAGTIFSSSAILYPLVRPTFLYPSLNQTQTVVAGSPFPMSAVLSNGWPPPFGYQWRSNSITVTTLVSNSKTNYFVYPASAVATGALTAALYRVVATNRASPGLVVNAAFYVTTLLDTDHDGLPDSVETALGLNPNNPADALLDLDGDGMSNLAEYLAGTDPNDPASYLRIDQTIIPGVATLNFAAVSNRTYTIQYSDSLPAAFWSRLADFIALRTNRVEEVTDPGWSTNRFYRVVIPRQP